MSIWHMHEGVYILSEILIQYFIFILPYLLDKNHKRVIFASKVAILSSFHERKFLSHYRTLSSCVEVCRAYLYMHYYIHIVTCAIFLWVWHVIPACNASILYVTIRVCVCARADSNLLSYIRFHSCKRVARACRASAFVTWRVYYVLHELPERVCRQHPTVVLQYRSVARSGFNQVF